MKCVAIWAKSDHHSSNPDTLFTAEDKCLAMDGVICATVLVIGVAAAAADTFVASVGRRALSHCN